MLCVTVPVCPGASGPADPDGGVDAPAAPPHPAAHLRLPAGGAQRGRPRQGPGARPGGPGGGPQPQHPQRPQLRVSEYVAVAVVVVVAHLDLRAFQIVFCVLPICGTGHLIGYQDCDRK